MAIWPFSPLYSIAFEQQKACQIVILVMGWVFFGSWLYRFFFFFLTIFFIWSFVNAEDVVSLVSSTSKVFDN